MNVEEAKKFILRLGWVSSIEKVPNVGPKGKRWLVRWSGGIYSEEITDRALCNMASRQKEGKESWKNNVKHYGKRKNRAATRDALKSEDYDKIPQQGRTKDEDPWAWD